MYFIIGMNTLLTDKNIPLKKLLGYQHRCYGYYSNLKDAKQCIENNTEDIYETIYPYVMIEKVEEGFYADSEIVHIYKYNKQTKQFEEMPLIETSFCNYSIG